MRSLKALNAYPKQCKKWVDLGLEPFRTFTHRHVNSSSRPAIAPQPVMRLHLSARSVGKAPVDAGSASTHAIRWLLHLAAGRWFCHQFVQPFVLFAGSVFWGLTGAPHLSFLSCSVIDFTF